MKKIKFALLLGLLACTTYALLASNIYENSTSQTSTTSACSLTNPPCNQRQWKFQGHQAIGVQIVNGNILGVTVSLTCHNYTSKAPNYCKHFILLPKGRTECMRYDIFGYLPIGWNFMLSTDSDAALIYGQAIWADFSNKL